MGGNCRDGVAMTPARAIAEFTLILTGFGLLWIAAIMFGG